MMSFKDRNIFTSFPDFVDALLDVADKTKCMDLALATCDINKHIK